MSELTTEQVKYCATDGYRGIEEDEFDAWLTQHDAEAIAKAEARIIKLLEESNRIGIFIPQGVVHTCDKATDPNSVCSCWQIALIQKKANN